MKIEAILSVKLVNALNQREHWATKAKRAKIQRAKASIALRNIVPPWGLALHMLNNGADWKTSPITITITRRGGRRMDDDGLTASAKHVRDGIADWLGIDDGDPRLTWVVRQDKAPRGQHWVDVEVTA